jgi:hypothetical protein
MIANRHTLAIYREFAGDIRRSECVPSSIPARSRTVGHTGNNNGGPEFHTAFPSRNERQLVGILAEKNCPSGGGIDSLRCSLVRQANTLPSLNTLRLSRPDAPGSMNSASPREQRF